MRGFLHSFDSDVSNKLKFTARDPQAVPKSDSEPKTMAQYVKTPLSHTVAVDLTNQSYDGPQSPPQALKLPSPCDFLVYFFIYFMFPLSELLMETAQLVRTSMSPCGPGPSHDAEAAEVLLGLRARHEMTFFHFLSEATGPLELLESLAPGQVHVTGGWLRDRLLESQEVNERARLQWQRLQRLMATPRGDLDLIVSRPLADFYGALRDDEALRSVLQRPPLLVPKKGSRSATVSLRCKSRSAFEPGKPIGNPLETHHGGSFMFISGSFHLMFDRFGWISAGTRAVSIPGS